MALIKRLHSGATKDLQFIDRSSEMRPEYPSRVLWRIVAMRRSRVCAPPALAVPVLRALPFDPIQGTRSEQPMQRRILALALIGIVVGLQVISTKSRATCPEGPFGMPNVSWTIGDNVTNCPAGDSVLAGHPSVLRIVVTYTDNDCVPRPGVPPGSIYVSYVTTGNLKFNDKGTYIYADDTTDAYGRARITIPSFSGCGNVTLLLRVSGVGKGSKTATVRSTDTNSDGKVIAETDYFLPAQPCDLNYSGTVDVTDVSIAQGELDHWHRHALHGTLVKRTSLCDNCFAGGNTVSAEGRYSWSPSGRQIAYSIHAPITSRCNLYIVPSDPVSGNTPIKFTFRPDSSDYDPSWSPLGHEILFQRRDKVIYRKGVPWVTTDTTEVGIYRETDSGKSVGYVTFSPTGDSVAFTRSPDVPPMKGDLWTMPAAPGLLDTIRQITSDDLDKIVGRHQWSPDGRILIFERIDRTLDPRKSELYKVSTSNAEATRGLRFFGTYPESAVQPSYSPDSQVVVACLGHKDSTFRTPAVLETAAPLSTIKAITSNYPAYASNSQDPILSPDGTRLAVLARNPAVVGANSPQLWAVRRNMNLPPQFTTIGSHTVADSSATVSDAPTVGQNFSFTVTATDPEGDSLSYDAYSLQQGMAFDRSTRTFSWTPPPLTTGKTYKVKFIVMTVSGGTDVIIDKLAVQPCCLVPQSTASEIEPQPVEGPNPTSGRFSLATPLVLGAMAELAVYDLGGRRVAAIRGPSGSPLIWQGRDRDSRLVQNGVYFYRLRVASYERRGRVVVLR